MPACFRFSPFVCGCARRAAWHATPRGTCRAAAAVVAAVVATVVVLLLGAAPTPAAAQAALASNGYTPCLGCAEHSEMQTRWHRPFLVELAGEGALAFDHFRVEGVAQRLGMCEGDPLLRSPVVVNGCHAYSAPRAWLIAAPLELVAFASPAWGLERRGHPRWAMALLLVPIAYHAFSIRSTDAAIRAWQQEQLLYH